jgi:peptidoglycan hydrolase CwlO-like protein
MPASTRAAFAAITAALLILLAGAPSGAVGTDQQPTVTALRAQADTIAAQYFAALARYQVLDRKIADNQDEVATLRDRARKARSEARARAISFYRTSNTRLTSVIASEDAFVAARRMRLIGQVSDRDRAVYARLRAATKRLNASRHRLETERKEQSDALADLQSQSSAMESKLALAQQLEQAAAQTATAAAAQAAPPSVTAATVPPATTDVAPAAPVTTAAPTTTTTVKPPSTPVSPPYVGTPGTNPHHDDPFLTCVRQRESGGNYGAVNPAGPYLGAYQFLQSTWNATANHMGRPALVGVPPNIATPYDQDDVAWALYQWQGMGPWGGSCP